jgi:hypothetical protein
MSLVPARAAPYRRWNPEQVRSIPADRFFVIQFDDADKVQVGGDMEDITQRRHLPGEGHSISLDSSRCLTKSE